MAFEEQIEQIESTLAHLKQLQDLEQSFAVKANERFKNNLAAFKQYYPDIYQKFVAHQVDDKFKLFINSDGSANLVDYDTGVAIYPENAIEFCHKQVKKSLQVPVAARPELSAIEYLKNETGFTHVEVMKEIGHYYNQARKSLATNNQISTYIPSMVVFGIGLGYHLPALFAATTPAYINLFEPNEDYFFASLFCIDWAGLLNQFDEQDCCVYFAVGVDEDLLYQCLYKRAEKLGPFTVTNSFFYQHYPSISINNQIAKIKDNFSTFFMGWGFFDDQLMGIAHTVKNSLKPIHLIKSGKNLPKVVSQYPIFIIANGPSLDKDIEQVKRYQSKAIIVACNSATTALIKHGIVPDFHVALERTKATYDFLSVAISKEHRKKINLLTVNVMYPEVMDLFDWCGIGLKGSESGTMLLHIAQYLKRNAITTTLGYCNPLVGNTALSFFVQMGFENIYLFGADSGYKDKEHHHSKASYYYDEKGKTIYKPLSMGGEKQVPGNFGKQIITDDFMYTGLLQMQRLLEENESPSLNCFNCSDGAKINGTQPLQASNILLMKTNLSKSEVVEHIKQHKFERIDSNINLEGLLCFEQFGEVCQQLCLILEEDKSDRCAALAQLLESLRYLYSFKQDAIYASLYILLEGEALYVSNVLLSLLYNFGSDHSIMPFYNKAKKVWSEFLEKAPTLYQERWGECSDYSFDYSALSEDES